MDKEIRQLTSPVTLELRDGERPRIRGTAARFFDGSPETEFRIFDGLVERIMPGAFDRAIKERHDVVALFNHDDSKVLGRTTAGTLALSVRDDGLHYSITPGDSTPHRDVAEFIGRGEVRGSSFAFRVAAGGSTFTSEDGVDVREIRDVDLLDVSPVTRPAYEGTDASLRGCQAAVEEYDRMLAERSRCVEGGDWSGYVRAVLASTGYDLDRADLFS